MIVESFKQPQMSFEEFKKDNPEIARAGETLARYRELRGHNQDFFFDAELYELVKAAVGGDVFNHPGTNLFELYIQERRNILNSGSDIGRQPGGEQHLPPAIELLIKLLQEELDTVKAENPQIEAQIGTTLNTIIQTGVTQLKRDEIINQLKKNIYLIPAVSIAYQIHFYSDRLKIALDKINETAKLNEISPKGKGGAAERARQYFEQKRKENNDQK